MLFTDDQALDIVDNSTDQDELEEAWTCLIRSGTVWKLPQEYQTLARMLLAMGLVEDNQQ